MSLRCFAEYAGGAMGEKSIHRGGSGGEQEDLPSSIPRRALHREDKGLQDTHQPGFSEAAAIPDEDILCLFYDDDHPASHNKRSKSNCFSPEMNPETYFSLANKYGGEYKYKQIYDIFMTHPSIVNNLVRLSRLFHLQNNKEYCRNRTLYFYL